MVTQHSVWDSFCYRLLSDLFDAGVLFRYRGHVNSTVVSGYVDVS